MSAGEPTPDAYFDAVYANGDDPWHYRTRWFEARKRALLLAMLDRPRYRSAFEPGCANGEMTAALAPRCDALLAADRHPRAVEAAAARAAHDQNAAHVRVETIQVPAEWPQQRFDLVVLSEFCYYLAPGQVAVLARHVRESMEPDGLLLACHWRHPFDEQACPAPDVHRILEQETGFARTASYREDDFMIDAWAADGLRPTQREAG